MRRPEQAPLVAAVFTALGLSASVGCQDGGSNGGALPLSTPPAASIDLGLLVGVHDPRSSNYDGDCVGCHGDLAGELALDGVTPTAHSTMLYLHGSGNERCIGCHTDSTDFLAYSNGNLRKQINVETALCTTCHGGKIAGFPQFYVR